MGAEARPPTILFAQGKNIIYDEKEYCLPIESNIETKSRELFFERKPRKAIFFLGFLLFFSLI